MIDLERITHPLRLARGSHQPGSGKGCAMNVISYINGDTKITDYPECSGHKLAQLVQALNDFVADPVTGLLSAEDSVRVLDLAWKTVGTAGKMTPEQEQRLHDDHCRRNDMISWGGLRSSNVEQAYRLCEETLNLGLKVCGMGETGDIDPVAVDAALEKIGA